MTDTAIPERGEVEIVLDGKAYPMRPSRAAAKAIELGTGRSLESLIYRMAQGSKEGLTLTEREIIVTEGIKAAGKDRGDPMLLAVNQEKIGELLYAAGVLSYISILQSFLLNAVLGGVDASKKALVVAESKETA